METYLEDKVAIVTGGASGIGRAAALALAAEGAHIAVLDLNATAARAVAAEVESRGRSALDCPTDITRPDQVEAAIADVKRQFGRIDILVNCAGIAQFGPLMQLTVDDWDRVLEVNLKGTVICCQSVLPIMQAQGYGHIINMGSVAGQIGGQVAGANYAASKAGVISFTKSLAKQFGRQGIIVNVINPGPVISPMTADWPQEWIDDVLAGMPLGRLGKPEEIAALVVFLASGLADYLHGSAIDINGGMYLG